MTAKPFSVKHLLNCDCSQLNAPFELSSHCLKLVVRPEGANYQWRRIHPESCRLIR